MSVMQYSQHQLKKEDKNMVNAFNTLIKKLTTHDFKPTFYIIDNEYSTILQKNIN